MFTESDWYAIAVRSLTAIRCEWPVSKLQAMAAEGHDTAVCGDTMRHWSRV